MTVVIKAGDYQATLVEQGAGLAGLTSDGLDLVVPHDPAVEPLGYSGKVLTPWPNRITDGTYRWEGETLSVPINETVTQSALHGLRCWDHWEVLSRTDDSVTFRTEIEPTSGYPFHVETTATYSLDPETGLSITVATTNLGEVDAPYGTSIHPYLTCGTSVDDAVLTSPAATVLEVDERLSPLKLVEVEGTRFDLRGGAPMKDRQIDHAFTDLPEGTWQVVLRDPVSGRGVELSSDHPWLQIYSGEILDRRGVAVEPMTCPPNAFNSGTDVIVLQPGETHSFHAAIRRAD
ncbi:aldose-1-epimerase [Actinomyces minihominis]|uniref:aldose-1-epimerase n=1 Tax=Actinomyces minihominis TaxID=2002838 RepID=UPI0013EA3080|nr:aldose-1-epimerase [Actinomyces minihominis]